MFSVITWEREVREHAVPGGKDEPANCPLSLSTCRTLCPSTRISRTSTPEICTCGSGTTGTGPSAACLGPKWTWCNECPTTTTGLLSEEEKNVSLCFGRVWMEDTGLELAALVALVKEDWIIPPLLGAVSLSLTSVLCNHGCRRGSLMSRVKSDRKSEQCHSGNRDSRSTGENLVLVVIQPVQYIFDHVAAPFTLFCLPPPQVHGSGDARRD